MKVSRVAGCARDRRPDRPTCLAAALLVTAAASAAAEDFTYVVRPGDNPWNLTERYLKSIDYWPRLQEYNRIVEPTRIPPGTRLRIPAGWLRGTPGAVRITHLTGRAEAQRGDDVTGTRLARGEKNGVTVQDAGVDHRVAAHAEREELRVWTDAERHRVDRDVAVGLLLGFDWQAGGDGAVEGDLDERAAARMGGGKKPAGLALEPAKRAFFSEGIDVPLDAEGTRQAEVGLNLAEGGSDAMLAVVGIDEIKDLLLTIGERFAHSVHVNTFWAEGKPGDEEKRQVSKTVRVGGECCRKTLFPCALIPPLVTERETWS